MIIAALSTEVMWGIGVAAPIIVGILTFVFAFKGKIMTAVDVKLLPMQDADETAAALITELSKRVSETETDVKLMNSAMTTLVDTIKENHRENKEMYKEGFASVKQLIREKEEDSKEQFKDIWKTISTKQDKK